ncbi:hypothetical protein IP88_02705, partial [alpha proteobacterium AAP81b]
MALIAPFSSAGSSPVVRTGKAEGALPGACWPPSAPKPEFVGAGVGALAPGSAGIAGAWPR